MTCRRRPASVIFPEDGLPDTAMTSVGAVGFLQPIVQDMLGDVEVV